MAAQEAFAGFGYGNAHSGQIIENLCCVVGVRIRASVAGPPYSMSHGRVDFWAVQSKLRTSPPPLAGQEAFASVDVYPDRLELRGHGVVESRTLSVRALA